MHMAHVLSIVCALFYAYAYCIIGIVTTVIIITMCELMIRIMIISFLQHYDEYELQQYVLYKIIPT